MSGQGGSDDYYVESLIWGGERRSSLPKNTTSRKKRAGQGFPVVDQPELIVMPGEAVKENAQGGGKSAILSFEGGKRREGKKGRKRYKGLRPLQKRLLQKKSYYRKGREPSTRMRKFIS